jgi:hypothetical protein
MVSIEIAAVDTHANPAVMQNSLPRCPLVAEVKHQTAQLDMSSADDICKLSVRLQERLHFPPQVGTLLECIGKANKSFFRPLSAQEGKTKSNYYQNTVKCTAGAKSL